jgi:HPt (histidine-containing phosphotransfer) domain-containing protein
MGETRDPEIDALLVAARVDFAGRLPAKVAEIEVLVTREDWQGARLAAHKLRGSAATYGFAVVGTTTAALEEELLLAAVSAPDANARARIAELSRKARAAADLAVTGPP